MDDRDHRADIEEWMGMWDELQGDEPAPKPAKLEPSYTDDDSQGTYWACLEDEMESLYSEHKTPNPVYPDSAGPDAEQPKAAWFNETFLKEIESLKLKLHELEDKVAKVHGGNNKWQEKCYHPNDKKLQTEIKSLKDKIEKISNTLGANHEASPWEVKE